MRHVQIRFTSETVFDSARQMLESLGCRVHAATTGPRVGPTQNTPALSQLPQYQPGIQSGFSQAPMPNPMMLHPPVSQRTQTAVPSYLSAFNYVPDPLPPPRTLPDFSGAQRPLGADRGVTSMEALPPLRKPVAVARSKVVSQTQGPQHDSGSSVRVSSPNIPSSSVSRPPANEFTTAAQKATSETARNITSSSSSSSHTVAHCNIPSSKRRRSASPERPSGISPFAIRASINGKEANSNRVREQGGAALREPDSGTGEKFAEQDRVHSLENQIIEKLHDEEFCKLVVEVSKVWQRMGFDLKMNDIRF